MTAPGPTVVALVSQKGGSGKSTLTLHLAVAALRSGRSVHVLDLDPQASAVAWSSLRASADVPVTPLGPSELRAFLARCSASLVLLDTPGRLDSTSAAAIALADFVLVPCRPSTLDLSAARATVDQVRRARALSKATFVLNGAPPSGSRHLEAESALADLLPVAPVVLRHRVAYADALAAGLSVEELAPDSPASVEIRRLYRWMLATPHARMPALQPQA
ncbi:MAG: AAA family ATPase [Myxococcales bacterium]|nr:AAA family ATPase [Myxococcales bacterium]